MFLADREDNGFADLAAHRIAQSVLQEGLAQDLIGGLGEEALLELSLFEGLLLVFTSVVREVHYESFFGEQFGGNFGASVHDRWIDEVSVLYAIKERVAEGRLTGFAAKGAVRIT